MPKWVHNLRTWLGWFGEFQTLFSVIAFLLPTAWVAKVTGGVGLYPVTVSLLAGAVGLTATRAVIFAYERIWVWRNPPVFQLTPYGGVDARLELSNLGAATRVVATGQLLENGTPRRFTAPFTLYPTPRNGLSEPGKPFQLRLFRFADTKIAVLSADRDDYHRDEWELRRPMRMHRSLEPDFLDSPVVRLRVVVRSEHPSGYSVSHDYDVKFIAGRENIFQISQVRV
jgi:hypothetical protein